MFRHYLRIALNHFIRHKTTTAINVVCLTIGLVCFLAIYAVLMYLRSGDGHYANADRIYMLNQRSNSSLTASAAAWNVANYLKVEFPELESVARATFSGVLANELPVSAGDRKGFVYVSFADPELLSIFALPFLAGDACNALRSPASTVISADAATRFFGGASQAIGRSLRLQTGQEITVRGVVGPLREPSHIRTSGAASAGTLRFDALMSMDVLESLGAADPMMRSVTTSGAWSSPIFLTYAVLPADGSLTAEAFRGRLATFGKRYADSPGNVFQFGAVRVGDYWLGGLGAVTGSDRTGIPVSAIFYFLGGIVLLTSCLNYSNLATAQATTRAKEIGMRRVVGARRTQIITQFMFEAALLSVAAWLCAVAVVALSMAVMRPPGIGFVMSTVATSGQFWLTLLALLAVVTLAAGVYPAFILSGVRPIRAAQAGKVKSGGRFVARLLVGLQFAAASFLLISMLVMLAQNAQFKRAVLSRSADTLISISNSIRQAGIDYEVLRAELERQPHVKDVTASSFPLGQMIGNTDYTVLSPAAGARRVASTVTSVNYDFFSTLDIGLLAGRVFDRNYDDAKTSVARAGAPASIVIDRALAEQQGWATPADAVGQTIYIVNIGAGSRAPTPRIVIGVVENRAMTLVSPFGATSNIYELVPLTATLPIVRIAAGEGATALKEIESVWNELAPSVALKMEFADQTLERAYDFFEGITTVFLGVAMLALAISVLGLIGMSIQVIGRRQHEIGVRKTLGASVRSVVRLLLTDFSKPVIIANVLVWPLAYGVMALYLSVFTQRTSLSPAPFIASLAITVLIAWIAVAAQATQAARLNPARVLRYE